jgi:hypothetical protein
MLFLGARDNIVLPETVKRLEPKEYGLNVFQIGGLSHFPLKDLEWYSWYHDITQIIINYIKYSKIVLPSREDILKEIYEFHARTNFKLLEDIYNLSYESLWKRVKILKRLTNEDRRKLAAILMRSRLFFNYDEDLRESVIIYGEKHNLLSGKILQNIFSISEEEISAAMIKQQKKKHHNKIIAELRVKHRSIPVRKVLYIQKQTYKEQNIPI